MAAGSAIYRARPSLDCAHECGIDSAGVNGGVGRKAFSRWPLWKPVERRCVDLRVPNSIEFAGQVVKLSPTLPPPPASGESSLGLQVIYDIRKEFPARLNIAPPVIHAQAAAFVLSHAITSPSATSITFIFEHLRPFRRISNSLRSRAVGSSRGHLREPLAWTWLLAQLRRASLASQQKALEWLRKKFAGHEPRRSSVAPLN